MSRDAWDEFSKTILVSYIASYLCGSFYLDRSASLKKIVAIFSDRCLSTHALTCLSCALSISVSPALPTITKGSLSKGVFERRTSTGSELFSLLTCLDDIKFVFLSFFTVIEAI